VASERPEWYRGPDDPSGYRVAICLELRDMRTRVRLSQIQMAEALRQELRRPISDVSVSRWETGFQMASAAVYLAYMHISAGIKPFEGDADDPRIDQGQLVAEADERLRVAEVQVGILDDDDLIGTSEAMELAGVSRETIHEWRRQHHIRGAMRSGRRLEVSRRDVLAWVAEHC
jgi:excisionase family DNA binding protein